MALYCTVLHSSVLYCIKRGGWKREKWENLQSSNQRTFQTLRPPFSRWSRDRESSRANNCTVLHSSVLYCIKRGGWKRKKLENLQTHKEQSDNQTIRRFKDWDHSNPLITRGSWPINSTPFYSILWRWPVLKFHPWLLLCPSIFRLGLSRHCSVVAAPITESNVCVWDPW